jgi:anti-anti-sigma factor
MAGGTTFLTISRGFQIAPLPKIQRALDLPIEYNTTHSRREEATVATPSSLPFGYEVELSGDTTLVKCHGDVVSETAGDLKQLIKPMIPKCRRIVLDLTDVNFVDSSGLGTLVGLKVYAGAAAYCSLEFINFSPHVKELLHTTRLSQLLGS